MPERFAVTVLVGFQVEAFTKAEAEARAVRWLQSTLTEAPGTDGLVVLPVPHHVEEAAQEAVNVLLGGGGDHEPSGAPV